MERDACSWASTSTTWTPRAASPFLSDFVSCSGSDAVLSRGKDGCLSLHRREEWDVIAAGQRELMKRGETERTMARSFFAGATPGRSRRAGPHRHPALLAFVRPAREGRRGQRGLRLHRDLGLGEVPGSGRRGCRGAVVGRRRRLRALGTQARKRGVPRHGSTARTAQHEPLTTRRSLDPGPSPAPRLARLLAPTPPAFSRSHDRGRHPGWRLPLGGLEKDPARRPGEHGG